MLIRGLSHGDAEGGGRSFDCVFPDVFLVNKTGSPSLSHSMMFSKLGLHDISFEHHHRDVRVCNSHIAGPAM